jgi:hypothetical protein
VTFSLSVATWAVPQTVRCLSPAHTPQRQSCPWLARSAGSLALLLRPAREANDWPGSPGGLPRPGSHRSGRAVFPHPARLVNRSLLSAVVSLTRFRVSEHPPCFPPLAPGRAPVRQFQRYYEALRLLYARPGRLIGFAVAVPPSCVACFAPHRPDATGGQGPLRFGRPTRADWYDGGVQLSQVPGEPCCSYARVFDPDGTDTPGHTACRLGPHLNEREGYPPRGGFRGSIAGPDCWLSTLRRVGRPTTTQDSLPAAGQLYRVGLVTHRVPAKGFRCLLHPSSFPRLRLAQHSTPPVEPRKRICG